MLHARARDLMPSRPSIHPSNPNLSLRKGKKIGSILMLLIVSYNLVIKIRFIVIDDQKKKSADNNTRKTPLAEEIDDDGKLQPVAERGEDQEIERMQTVKDF
jgi:hypothetical protein